MIKQFSDHTCINMSPVFDHHLTTLFPAMNKTRPKPPSNTEHVICSGLASTADNGTTKDCDLSSNSIDTSELVCSSEDDVQHVVSGCHGDDVSRVSGGLIATQLLDILQRAVMKRVTLIPDCHKHLEYQQTMCSQSEQQEVYKLSCNAAYNQVTLSDAKVAILFSGGVDSMVLAALADR